MSAYDRTHPDSPDQFDTITDAIPSRGQQILAALEGQK